MVGYPCNENFDYSELLPFLEFHTNNVGDPFGSSNFGANTFEIEREVLEIFAKFTQAPSDEFWGYVTTGGTEGNMYGLYLARELYPDGIVYYSEETHYSVAKSLRVLRTRSVMIKSQQNGEIDYEDLFETLRIHRDSPAIIFANVGTTMKGAVDDVGRLRAMLRELRVAKSYIHVDAALSGMILPFVEEPGAWNFSAGADSISISGHKMLGSPLPSGILLAKKSYVDRIARSVEYVGALDTTLSGSRSAFSPLILWYALKRLGETGLRENVRHCIELAQYATVELEKRKIPAWRNHNSITVIFPRPSESVIRKWQIAPYKDIGHMITMPHVTKNLVDQFIQDYLRTPPHAQVSCPLLSPGVRSISTRSSSNEKDSR